MKVLDVEEIKKEYSFLFEDSENNQEVYFCSCGKVTIKDKKKPQVDVEITETETLESKPHERVNYLYPKNGHEIKYLEEYKKDIIEDEEIEDDYSELFKSIKLSEYEDNRCDGCEKNFSTLENQKKLIVDNSFFVSGYNFSEDEFNLILYFGKLKPLITKNSDDYSLNFEEKTKTLRYNKENKKLYFKDYDSEEIEFDLDKIVKITDNIFLEEIQNIYNILQLQVYIGQLSKYVIDVRNTNVVQELLEETKNSFHYSGLDSIKKVISIFLGIIKYSNLSTIALTKGCKFLYDLMKECDIPSSSVLEENQVTSPIAIFNYLVAKYISNINEEVNEDNKEVHEFLFKSSQVVKMEIDEKDKKQEAKSFEVVEGDEKEMKIIYKDNKDYKTKVSHNSDSNKFQILEISNDANASKFIYKNIKNFSDYKQLLKYFKFYDKHQIISLLQKYDLELLIRVVDLIYFRDTVDFKEFERIITIIKDYVVQETLKFKPTLNMDNFKPDYTYTNKFEFVYYDDSVMMMEVLEFDPRKHFNKIKTYRELMEYHNNLVKYFNVVADKEKNAKFKTFVERFKFLESREDYDGTLEFKLISTPAMLIAEGVHMKHSASSYSKKVITESYLIGQIFDKTPGLNKDELTRFTIGFTFDSINGLEFHQVKGIANKPGSDNFKKLLMEFLTTKDISFRPVKDLKLQNE